LTHCRQFFFALLAIRHKERLKAEEINQIKSRQLASNEENSGIPSLSLSLFLLSRAPLCEMRVEHDFPRETIQKRTGNISIVVSMLALDSRREFAYAPAIERYCHVEVVSL